MNGKVYLISVSNLRRLPEKVKRKFLITRKYIKLNDVVYLPSLAPSKQLFYKYLKEWKNKPGSEWWTEYSKLFNEEIMSNNKLDVLSSIHKILIKGEDIALICFCNTRYCHRYLIGKYFKLCDIIVEEIL